MSSPPTTPPVVQTILESFTRCFNPLPGEPCSKIVCNSARENGSSASGGDNNKSSSTSAIRAISRSTSSSNKKNAKKRGGLQQHLQLDVSYDADGVASAKRTHHRMMLSAEAFEERSMKRKLEIFRTGTTSSQEKQKQASSSSSFSSRQQQVTRQRTPPSQASANNTNKNLSLSDDEEELIRLTQSSRKRFACGMIGDHGNGESNSPISSVARLFNLGMTEAQKPFGLCFATPVRTAASQEDITNLSDDKLTDDEFLSRHGNMKKGLCGGNIVSPDNNKNDHGCCDQSSSSYCEEETISSTLYFDHKISHLVQTRPPMPLFRDDMIKCSTESTMDDLSKIIKQRSAGNKKKQQNPPMDTVTSRRQQQHHPRGSPFRTSPKFLLTGGLQPPSPVRIRDESLSTNATHSTTASGISIHMSYHEDDHDELLMKDERGMSPTAAEF